MNSIRIVMMQKKNDKKIVLKLKLIYVKLQNSPITKYWKHLFEKSKQQTGQILLKSLMVYSKNSI